MRAICSTLIILIITKSMFSQNFAKVDSVVRTYSKTFATPEKIADLINKDFNRPEEKARAVYTWVALNITYDIKGMSSAQKPISYSYGTEEEKSQIEQKIRLDLAKETLKKAKAVCQGYSTLYKVICDLVGLECEIISGTSKTKYTDIGVLPKIMDHAWNAVKINNEWRLLDVTWGSGYLDQSAGKYISEFNDFYFLTLPSLFNLNHYPENRVWLLEGLTEKEFAELPLFYPYYFKMRVMLIEPKQGIIDNPRNNILTLKIKNIDGGSLSYIFSDEKYGNMLQPNREGDFYLISIECKRKSNTFLTIFLNNNSIFTLKIK